MKYLCSYILAQIGGNESPSAKDIDKIVGSVGLDFDAQKAEIVVNALKGKNIEEVITEGLTKLATVPSGGAAPAAAATSGAPSAGAPAAAAPAKEEKKPEKEEESDEDMGFGLFD